MQAQHAEWLKRKYPGQIPEFAAAGMVEEAGELMHALLKCQQANGGKHPDARYADADWSVKLVDAIGDCGVFAVSLCNTVGWDFASLLVDAAHVLPPERPVFQAAAQLVHVAADVCEAPTHRGCTIVYLAHLLRICQSWNIDFEAAVRRTWEVVRCR